MKYLTLFIVIGGIGLFVIYILLILSNNIENTFIKSTLNDNIISLLDGKKYTERTFRRMKSILLLRSVLFILGLIMLTLNSVHYTIKSFTPLVLIGIRTMTNIFIERDLEKDYITWEDIKR